MSRSPPNRGYIPLSNAEPPPAYTPQDSARSSSLDARAVPAQPPVQPSVQQQQSSVSHGRTFHVKPAVMAFSFSECRRCEPTHSTKCSNQAGHSP